MRRTILLAALAALVSLCGCFDYTPKLEAMIEKALGGVDCDIVAVADNWEDLGKMRRHTFTVTYRPRETLYRKAMLGDKKTVETLVKPTKQLTATIRWERGRNASAPAILKLSEDRLLDMWLMDAIPKSPNLWSGVVPESRLKSIQEPYLMEGTAAYAEQVLVVKEQEAAQRAKEEAERQARERELAAQRAKEEAERKAREDALAAQQAKEQAEREAKANAALAARIHARFAEIGCTDKLTVTKIVSVQGDFTTLECTASAPLVTKESEGTSWIDGDTVVKSLPDVVILKPVVPAGTPFTAVFKENGFEWRFDPSRPEKLAKAFVGRYDIGLVQGTPAHEEFVAYVTRLAALERKIAADRARLREIGDEKTQARRNKRLFLTATLNRLDKERDTVQARVKANETALRGAKSLLDTRYRPLRGRVLDAALGLSATFGQL